MTPTLPNGTRLGPYEIVAPLGAGGMGEVYKARDTRLDRSVALKIVPAELAGQGQLRLRFEQEARTISQLSHPNICTLYDVGNDNGLAYLVMELLDGETLAERLMRGSLPVEDVLRIGMQMAEALDQAHRAGVVHRDLKPGNVMLTKNGAKLLDFGLAKPSSSGDLLASTANDPTVAMRLTEAGTIVGTFQYMAPEQLEGREIDHRADLWALGCTLYEMVTGVPPFRGATKASLIGSVLRDEPPPIPPAPPLMSGALDRIIRSCLAKNRDDRWQSARDLALELGWILQGTTESAGVHEPVHRWIGSMLWISTIVAAIVATALLAPLIASRFRGFHSGPPVIVLVDSTHPERVYDDETRRQGGTNADDLTDVLQNLPVSLVKENTTWTWHREDEVLRQKPDLILIHRSCFYVPSGLDKQLATVKAPPSSPFPSQFEAEFYERSADKLEVFLGYIALDNPRTKFIVYSRRSWNGDADRKRWVAALESRFPQLRGRVTAWSVPLDRATFRNPQTGAEMKKMVVAALGLRR